MIRTKEKIFKAIEANKEKIRSFGVRRLALFGSIVRNEGTEASDLDFLVDLDPKTFDNYMDLKEFLEDLFQCKVDLVCINAIKPRLKPYILNEAVYAQGF